MNCNEYGTTNRATAWLRKLRRGAAVLLLGTLVGLAGPAHAQTVSGTVEQGLTELAMQIAEKSKAAGRTTIAVLPFQHADGVCSVLSTYIVDELILALFSQPDSQLDIIERAQLEALIAEMQIGQGGLLNPATTKELGNISGVSALTIGTVTVIGDLVRLNARLVATDTGRTISAAAVTVPKTAAVSALLAQPAPCSSIEASPAGQRAGTASSGQAGPSQLPHQDKDGLRLEMVNVKQGRTLAMILRITNISEKPMQISHLDNTHELDDGTLCELGDYGYGGDVNGMSDGEYTLTRIDAGETVQYSVSSVGCSDSSAGKTVSSRIVLLVQRDRGAPAKLAFQLFEVPLNQDQ